MVYMHKVSANKISVLSQFNLNLAIMGRLLQEAKIDFLYYTWEVSQVNRPGVVEKFQSEDAIKVLVRPHD